MQRRDTLPLIEIHFELDCINNHIDEVDILFKLLFSSLGLLRKHYLAAYVRPSI